MIPLRDYNPSGKTPYVTYGIIILNAIVAAFLFFLGPLAGELVAQFGLVPARIIQGDGWWGLLTSMFLHGGFFHLIGNMLFLHVFGDNVEAYLGHGKYLLLYLVGGLVAGITQLFASWNSTVPMIGASGAVAGIMGGYLALYPKAKIDTLWIIFYYAKVIQVSAKFILLYWIIFQFIYVFITLGQVSRIGYFAHVGGFLFGYFFIKWIMIDGPKPLDPDKIYE